MKSLYKLNELVKKEPNSFVDGPFGSNLKASEYKESGIQIIRLQNIRPNKFLNKEIKFISHEKAIELSRHDFRPGDLVIAKLGDPTGVACIIPEHQAPGRIVADVVRFRGDDSLVDHEYISHFLNSPHARKQLERGTTGTTRKRINLTKLKSVQIPLPPLAEQKRIASILDLADALRAKRRESLAQLDALLQSTFLDMFGDSVTNPMGWEEVSVADLCETPDDVRCGPFGTQLHQKEFTNFGIPLWGIKHVNSGFSFLTDEYVSTEKAKKLSNYSIIPGDLVMTRKGTIGNCQIYPDSFDKGIMHSDLLRIRISTKKANSQFIVSQFTYSLKITKQLELMRAIVKCGVWAH